MIKLLIVDDEPLVQIGIKSMLKWEEMGIEVCKTAMNGEQALKMIEEYSPEIVITDIRMPIMNGLELAKACRDTYGSIPLFIFLTSYEEFQLIKEAMTYEAVDYLIKLELTAQSLKDAVDRALERLSNIQAVNAYRDSGRPLLQNYFDKFFMRLLHGLFESEDQYLLQAKDLKLDLSEHCYCAALCGIIENSQKDMDYSQRMNLFSSSMQMAWDIVKKHMAAYLLSLDMKHFVLIFHLPQLEDFSLDQCRQILLNAGDMVKNYFGVTLFAGIGVPIEYPLRLCESYQEARQAFSQAQGNSPVAVFSQENDTSLKNAFNISVFKNELTKAFDEFDTDSLYKILTEIIELFRSHPMRFLQALDGACNILYLSLSMLPDGEENMTSIFSSYNDGYLSLYRFTSMDQIIEWLTVLRDGLCSLLHTKRRTYKAHVITNVQKYINNHIRERLSLNEVAGVFGLSPNYLSVLFKKHCQIGFSEYITQAKISQAKALLLEQDLKVYEIAEQLGFESSFYFSKVFKKVEGISPREFLQQNTVQPEDNHKDNF